VCDNNTVRFSHRADNRRFAQDSWQELDASSRRSSEMARDWRGLCPAVDCGRLIICVCYKFLIIAAELPPVNAQALFDRFHNDIYGLSVILRHWQVPGPHYLLNTITLPFLSAPLRLLGDY
jgi:hypothetical protein